MIQHGFPSAGRLVASHCDALFARPVSPADVAHEIAGLGKRLSSGLRRDIAAIWRDAAGALEFLGTREIAAPDIGSRFGKLMAGGLCSFGAHRQRMFIALEGRALLEQLDLAFGGTGELEGDLPAKLPFSASLLAERVIAAVVSNLMQEAPDLQFAAERSEADAMHSSPFDETSALTIIEFEYRSAGGRPWLLALLVETPGVPALFPRRPKRGDGLSFAALADLPLHASAPLVDMDVPLHRLHGLEPGTVLPIIVSRNVPLQIGGITVARGSVGSVDEQVALQINQTFSGKEPQ